MVEIQFVGDINELCEEQKNFIKNVVEENGFENANINVQPVGQAGDNYVANVKRIIVEKDGETFKMIAKVAPKNETLRSLGNMAFLFQNEDLMYNQVLPKFTEIEKAANIPEEERLRYAMCYGTYMEAPNEIILLEDLEVSGFKMLDRFTPLTDESVRLVLESFASLHSLSYALKYQEPETFEKFSQSLVNPWSIMIKNPGMLEWFAQLDSDVISLLDDDKCKNAIKNVITKMVTLADKLAKFDNTSKHSVIQQGDPWTNNIMFRLEDDRSVECCMIDYQISKQSNPVADLNYMIFNCTDHATRALHFHDWIDYYHSQLDKCLANYGLKANYVYPKDQLDADLRRYSKVALGVAVMLSTVLVRDTASAALLKEAMNTMADNTTPEDIAKASENVKLSNADTETINKFRAKVEGLVNSFVEFGYI